MTSKCILKQTLGHLLLIFCTLCFCWPAWYETDISLFAKKPKIDENRWKNRSDNASRTRSAKKTRFFRSRTRLGVDFSLLGALPGAPGRPFWRPGAPLATLRTLSWRAGDAPETLPRRSRDAFGTLLDVTGCPERVPGAIFTRFWVPRGVSGDRFSIDFHNDCRSILQASWPANGKNLDG